jgi:glutamate-ammonia-ligase adenylyltransferase
MKPRFNNLRDLCPDVSEHLIRAHLERLEESYFQLFDSEQICSHLRALARLTAEAPVQVIVRAGENRAVDCTVLAFDYPGEFSVISGILGALGVNILSGNIFTYERLPAAGPEPKNGAARRRGRAKVSGGAETAEALSRRRIIDTFSGLLDSDLPLERWAAELEKRLRGAVELLEAGRSALDKAKQTVNEQVAERLVLLKLKADRALYPVHIEVDNTSSERTLLKISTQDTPFFLYALSTALALQGVSIETVRIRTEGSRIEDEFSLLDAQGRKILDPELISRVKLSVLLTKQFTYFLGSAPNPYAALCRFEQLAEEVLSLPEQGRWLELLSNPLVLSDLARLLGTSDFLWEEFIRLQYETLIPMLEPHLQGQRFAGPPETLPRRLASALEEGDGYEEKRKILNAFKDREIYLLDLDHILTPGSDFRDLSEGLTRLAETVVKAAAGICYERLVTRHGVPQTVAGLEARYAVLGLGKLGGGGLGYASDIELLFVYSDNGASGGARVISNAEFFDQLVRRTTKLIEAKQEGIFHVDLRLRPYGLAGPAACSLESFCQYYGPRGEAHALERLALVRLRAMGGDGALGAQIERLRDEMLYAGSPLSLADLRAARQKQFEDKTSAGKLSAKFSPGALVDLEYTVQLLQVSFGRDKSSLRTPRIWEALDSLAAEGILQPSEAERIRTAYTFFRRLINSLRMLRGSARDLMLPSLDSDEYIHLARRMGYQSGAALSPAQQLHLEFETHTASIRVFVEDHLGRSALPGPAGGNVADLILSDQVPESLVQKILANAGFKDTERAFVNLRSLAGRGARNQFARLAVLATDFLQHQPDPDMALNNYERFIRSQRDPGRHYQLLLSQPRRLDILMSIFSGSQFLSDVLIRNPEFFGWATLPENLGRVRSREQVEALFQALSSRAAGHAEWLDLLRRYRLREVLRIGIRDIFLGRPLETIVAELSSLAEAILEVSLQRIWRERGQAEMSGDFCVLAFGKLGGAELNYSSDLDLLGLYARAGKAREVYRQVMESLSNDLSRHQEEGIAYRVDLRLRPYGSSGELAYSLAGLVHYFQEEASPWEIQALIKARPVAGNLDLGKRFLRQVWPGSRKPPGAAAVIQSIEHMRELTLKKLSRGLRQATNIKLGSGGIRDIEFLVQGLQLIHAREVLGEQDFLRSGNTCYALDTLRRAAVLSAATAAQLKQDYIFLRRLEHYLQIYEDRQTHTLPREHAELDTLAKRLLGRGAEAEQFLVRLEACNQRVEEAYRAHLLGALPADFPSSGGKPRPPAT